MHPFGSDRLRQGRGEQVILLSPRDKGWVPRTDKTLTTAEHPGTAVLWEDAYFQVVSATSSGSGIRYVLEPWPEEHAMRVTDLYDEASEARREMEHRAAATRRTGRKAANALGILTGHLPMLVQEQMGSELGILPARLSLFSLVLPFLYIVFIVQYVVRGLLDPNAPQTPLWAGALGAWFFIETICRFLIIWTQARPIGSVVGFIAYTLFYILVPGKRLVSPVGMQRGHSIATIPPSDDVRLRDAFILREPMLTLLKPEEQEVLAGRFGYDYRAHSSIVAWLLLVFSAAGIATSAGSVREGKIGALVSLVAAIAIAAEQVARLRAFGRGPAGSFLGVLVRPFARRLLAQ